MDLGHGGEPAHGLVAGFAVDFRAPAAPIPQKGALLRAYLFHLLGATLALGKHWAWRQCWENALS